MLLAQANATDWIGSLGSFIGAIAALAAISLGANQLRKLIDALRMSGLSAILQLESDIHLRKERVVESAADILRANLDLEDEQLESRKRRVQNEILILSKRHDALTEHWLNSAGRLAFVILYCLRKRYFKDRDWKAEYYADMKELVESDPEWFGSESPYTNVLKLVAKWERVPDRPR